MSSLLFISFSISSFYSLVLISLNISYIISFTSSCFLPFFHNFISNFSFLFHPLLLPFFFTIFFHLFLPSFSTLLHSFLCLILHIQLLSFNFLHTFHLLIFPLLLLSVLPFTLYNTLLLLLSKPISSNSFTVPYRTYIPHFICLLHSLNTSPLLYIPSVQPLYVPPHTNPLREFVWCFEAKLWGL